MKASMLRFIAILAAAGSFLNAAPVQGQGASCYISAGLEKTHVFVREVDSDGNPLAEIGGGWVDTGERLPMVSRTGRIVINYQLSSSDKSFETDAVDCSGGAVISVP
jgi:hypothetical protein